MSVGYNFVVSDGVESLTVVINGELHVVSPEHINYKRIKSFVFDGETDEQELINLINARTYASNKLQRLSERVSVFNDELMFDNDVIDNSLSKHIMRLLRNGDKFEPFVAFMENIADNPSSLSRIHLFKWLDTEDFTITDGGMIVGYKSVTRDRLSHHAGVETVFVDGVPGTGKVPNPDGAIVEMARTDVGVDRNRECSNGLHVGTWTYANSFYSGSPVLKVLVNPRDVVSVPKDSSDQKMRTCRYKIIGIVDAPNGDPVEYEPVPVIPEPPTAFSEGVEPLDVAFPDGEDEEEDYDYDDSDDYDDSYDYGFDEDEEEEEDEELEEEPEEQSRWDRIKSFLTKE